MMLSSGANPNMRLVLRRHDWVTRTFLAIALWFKAHGGEHSASKIGLGKTYAGR